MRCGIHSDASFFRCMSSYRTFRCSVLNLLALKNIPKIWLDSLYRTATAFADAISRMPGGALPVVGESGRTLEYPAPLLSMLPQLGHTKQVLKSDGQTRTLITEVDPGHRHWSALHWLYPGIFNPIGNCTKQSSNSRTTSHRRDIGSNAEQVWTIEVWSMGIVCMRSDRIIIMTITHCSSFVYLPCL